MGKRNNHSLTVRLDDLLKYHPETPAQQQAVQSWQEGDNLVLAGAAGTGKTFISLYLALETLLAPSSQYDALVIVRSAVPTRDMGFLPGTREEKEDAFKAPYKGLFSTLFGSPTAYNKMVSANQVVFMTTSYIRGITLENSIVIVDEMQNLNYHELDSVITRIGENCRLIFCGDYYQSDFTNKYEKRGIYKFLSIIEQMSAFEVVNFEWKDIVRSDLVRDYIMTKELLGIDVND